MQHLEIAIALPAPLAFAQQLATIGMNCPRIHWLRMPATLLTDVTAIDALSLFRNLKLLDLRPSDRFMTEIFDSLTFERLGMKIYFA